jgi:CO/xanthine dehydrogenase FAD-binding subunit
MPLPHEPPVESPRTLEEAYTLLADGRAWRPLAGGTDLMVELAAGRGAPPGRVLDLWRIRELRGVWLEPRALVLGALTTYADLRRSALANEIVPALIEAAASVGAAQIQNRGTLGGNIANASPAGDAARAARARCRGRARRARGERSVPIDAFFSATGDRVGRRRDHRPVRIPIVPGREVRFRKVGTRRAQAIAKVSLALAWRDGTDAERGSRAWRGVRVALGSVAAVPLRATATEAVLEGASPNPETADRAAETLAGELAPIDDVRSTAEYRRVVAARVIHRLVREAGGW